MLRPGRLPCLDRRLDDVHDERIDERLVELDVRHELIPGVARPTCGRGLADLGPCDHLGRALRGHHAPAAARRGPAPLPSSLQGKVKDDGQRISAESVERMRAYGSAYRTKRIPVSRVVSSEYYFVWQHAEAAFGAPIDIHRDLTGSLDFSDERELEASLQGLRNRTVTPPDPGSNTVLFLSLIHI